MDRRIAAACLLTTSLTAPGVGAALRAAAPLAVLQQQAEKFDFDVPPQVLAAAIPSFMHVTEVEVVFTPELVANKRTNGVFGSFTVEEGLDVLLDGTGLSYTFTAPKTFTLKAGE
jgi:iron complex outermembrane receptor protein